MGLLLFAFELLICWLFCGLLGVLGLWLFLFFGCGYFVFDLVGFCCILIFVWFVVGCLIVVLLSWCLIDFDLLGVLVFSLLGVFFLVCLFCFLVFLLVRFTFG